MNIIWLLALVGVLLVVGAVSLYLAHKKTNASPTYIGDGEELGGEPWPMPQMAKRPDPSPGMMPMMTGYGHLDNPRIKEAEPAQFGFAPPEIPLKNTEADTSAQEPANVTEVSIEREFPPIPRKPRKAAKKTAKKAVKKAAKKTSKK